MNENRLACGVRAGLLAVIAAAAWGPPVQGADATPDPGAAADLEVVRQRMVETLVPPGGPAPLPEAAARRLLGALDADGRWPDIDYASRGRAHWGPGNHVRRVLQLAQCYRTPGHPLAGSEPLRDGMRRALRWWITTDLQCPNWWWNDIGVPEALGKTLLLLGDEFPADLRPGASTILRRAEKQDMTGQNTLWVCGVRIARGCLEKEPDVVGAALRRIADEVKVSTGEGIQPDFSFHQHGPLLYSGGYGRGFAVYGPQFAGLAAGTRWAMPAEKVEILTRYLLDGEQWMIRGDRFDPSCVGREITRPGHDASALAGACLDMLALGAPRAAEFQALAYRLGGRKDAQPLTGNRHFWRSDFMVHQRPEWYASVRMVSKRLYNSELVNGEGKKSHHLADGLMLVMHRGREFDGVAPVWDWKRLPGTTCEQGPLPDPVKQRGETAFVGGASDGLYGVAAMDLKRGPLAAKKAWFFFDDWIVALGAGITCTSDQPVWTSVDQRLLRGPVVIAGGSGRVDVPRGVHTLESNRMVLHDGIGYVCASGPGQLKVDTQRGCWRDVSDPASAEPVEREMFSLGIDHGVRPSKATYAVVVAPFVAEGRLEGQAEFLSVTETAQAVLMRPSQVLGAVFWAPGDLDVPDLGTVAVDRPCVLLLRPGGAGLILAVSDPSGDAADVTVTVAAPLEGDDCAWSAEAKASTIRFNLPRGAEAGRSVVRELKRLSP